jgi:hypothetical protein
VESISPVPNRLQKPLPTIHSLDQTFAVYDIAATILELCNPPFTGLSIPCEGSIPSLVDVAELDEPLK